MENTQPQLPSKTIGYRPPLYLRFVFVLLTGFALTNMGILVFAQSIRPILPPSNPFLDYADIFPGHAVDALNLKLFTCANIYNYNLPSQKSCSIVSSSEIFSRVEIIIADDSIRQTTFTLRENTFKVGELVLLFDNPKFCAYPRRVFFFWSNLFVIVSTTVGNAPAIRPVWSVTFTDTY